MRTACPGGLIAVPDLCLMDCQLTIWLSCAVALYNPDLRIWARHFLIGNLVDVATGVTR